MNRTLNFLKKLNLTTYNYGNIISTPQSNCRKSLRLQLKEYR